MSITLQARVNGGAPQTSHTDAALGATIQLACASYASLGSPVARHEITDFPPGFALPAGWTSDVTAGSYYWQGNSQPPTFVASPWGCYVCKCVGYEGGVAVESKVVVDVLSTNGVRDLGRGEGALYGGANKRWVKKVQEAFRIFDAGGGGGAGVVAPTADELLLRDTGGEGYVTRIDNPGDVLAVGSASSEVLIEGAQLDVETATVALKSEDGTARITFTLANSCLMTLGDALTSFSLGWTQETSGAGKHTFINGQQGAAGSVGGNLNLLSGGGGTPGTNLGGNILLEVGQAVSNVTAKVQFTSNLGAILQVWQTAALTSRIGLDQAGAGVGRAVEVRAQQGAAGSVGGSLTLGGGDGGTGGTNLAGSTDIQSGTLVGNVSAKTRWLTGATVMCEASQTAASTFTVLAPSYTLALAGDTVVINAVSASGKVSICEAGAEHIAITSAASVSTILGAGGIDLTAGAGQVANITGPSQVAIISTAGLIQSSAPDIYQNCTTFHYRTTAFSTKCDVTVANAFVENFASGVTCDRQVNAASRVFVDSSGTRLTGNVRLASVISPTAITGAQTDYNPTNLLTSTRLRQDCSAAATINSMAAGSDGQIIKIFNISNTALNTLTLLHDDGATGTAAQRFLCPGNVSVVIPRNGCAEVMYDTTSARWLVTGKSL